MQTEQTKKHIEAKTATHNDGLTCDKDQVPPPCIAYAKYTEQQSLEERYTTSKNVQTNQMLMPQTNQCARAPNPIQFYDNPSNTKPVTTNRIQIYS